SRRVAALAEWAYSSARWAQGMHEARGDEPPGRPDAPDLRELHRQEPRVLFGARLRQSLPLGVLRGRSVRDSRAAIAATGRDVDHHRLSHPSYGRSAVTPLGLFSAQ